VDPDFRAAFNAAYDGALYEGYLADLERRLGCSVGFRIAETPVFFPAYFRERCERAAREIVAQLSQPDAIAGMRAAVPERYAMSHPEELPNVACVDFAIVRGEDGRFEPKLVELQGFPSLLAFETLQRDAWEHALQRVPGCEGDWSSWFEGDRSAFLALLRETIVGRHDPRNVVLLDLDPASQKTSADFAATKALLGVDAVDPRELQRRGRRLFRRDAGGADVPVERIYYRLVPDELERTGRTLPFAFGDALDVEWAPHPNWFWVWSKYSLPFLAHEAVPSTRFLSEVETLPADLETNYVLKPLFSFAGAGVNVHPTPGDVAAIPHGERAGWCLQEKIAYGPVFDAPDGGAVKVELRMMFLRPDGAPSLVPATNLCRLSRGDLLGVDFNKNKTWVGSSIGIWRA
jgi:hypothetical protein